MHTVSPSESAMRLVNFLAEREACSLRKAKALLDARVVFVNGKRVWMAKHTLRAGDRVEIQEQPRSTAHEGARSIPFLFENADYVVVDKPPGLLSNGPNSVESMLRQSGRYERIRAVHRLDKDTSGCLCLARHPAAFDRAVTWFGEDQVLKIYHALVWGAPAKASGRITVRIDGCPAVTHWSVLAATADVALLQVRLDTGRTHQIRKHLSGAGFPILGDRTYFTGRLPDPRLRRVPRQMLHAHVLQAPFDDQSEQRRVTAPRPSDFKRALKAFGL